MKLKMEKQELKYAKLLRKIYRTKRVNNILMEDAEVVKLKKVVIRKRTIISAKIK